MERGVGIDIVDVSRFKKGNFKKSFIEKVFSSYEINYCSKNKDPSTHFAGIFAAKEAVSKALGVINNPYIEIEIKHKKDGAPIAYKNSKKLNIFISISHTDKMACAIALM